MNRNIRPLLLIALGIILGFVLQIGIASYYEMKHPGGAITNADYNLVQVADKSEDVLCDLHKGESKLLGYGAYRITIADTKVSFWLMKNNRGICNIHSSSGVLVLETEGDCRVGESAFY